MAGRDPAKKNKKEKEFMDTHNSVVTGRRGKGRVEVEEGVEGINGNGKSTVKISRKNEVSGGRLEAFKPLGGWLR